MLLSEISSNEIATSGVFNLESSIFMLIRENRFTDVARAEVSHNEA